MNRGPDGRFTQGRSPNPAGRPRKASPAAASAFDVILDQMVPVTQDGVAREVTVEEALQHETLRAALKGQRRAFRAVLGWIDARERARGALRPQFPEITLEFEHDPSNADEAMSILGITGPNPNPRHETAKLQTWVTQAALSRPGRPRSQASVAAIKQATLEPERLRWTRRFSSERNNDE